MKISRRFTAVLGAAAAIALPAASQAQVTYYTTGVFNGGPATSISNNGMTLSFAGLGSTTINPTPSGISFGDFITSGTSGAGGSNFNGNTFTLNVFQTNPGSGSGMFVGSVGGTLYTNGGIAYWVPSAPLSINIGNSTYTMYTQNSTPGGPGWTINNPNTNNGHTTLQGNLTTPEPSSMALLGTGLVGLVPMIRRKKQS